MPSILFTNGKIWQPDGTFDKAFAIRDPKIDFVGLPENTNQSLYDKIIDLKGRLVLPGLIDGHLHLVRGSLMLKKLNSSGVKNSTELGAKIREYSVSNPSQKWIIGSNLDVGAVLKDLKTAKGNIIDTIYNEKPLFINNYDYHSAICNAKALEESGLLNKLDEFSDNEVMRDSEGNPTGIVKEKAQWFVSNNIPKPTLDEKVKAVEDFIGVLHSYGITTVSDITLIDELEVYKRLYELGKLKIRINSYIPFYEFENLKRHRDFIKDVDPDLLKIKGFKTYWDGALGSETALFSQNYKGKNHNGYKTSIVESGEVFELAKKIDSSGMQMIIHAIGDKAVSDVLDLYESLPYHDANRHRIEHAQHIQEKDFERFKKLNVIASVQPLHLKYDIKAVHEKLPAGHVNKTHNYKHLIDLGAVVNFGTDFPIVEVDPFENMRLAVTREGFTPELSINLHECIKGYTINNAYSNFNDDTLGTIVKGKAADFVIMQDDLFETRPGDISKAKVRKTYFNGEEVYSNS